MTKVTRDLNLNNATHPHRVQTWINLFFSKWFLTQNSFMKVQLFDDLGIHT